MDTIQERINEITEILIDIIPRYFFELDPQYNHNDFRLNYHNYTSASSFKNNFGRKVNKLIFDLKKETNLLQLKSHDLEIIIEELSRSIKTFELVKIRNIEFQYQQEAQIIENAGFTNYLNIENAEDKYFKQIAEVSQFRYECSTKFIKELKEILHIHKQLKPEEKEINLDELDKKIEEVTRVLYDTFPNYAYQMDYDIPHEELYKLRYYGYENSYSFKNSFGRKIDELILYLKKQKSINKISNNKLQEIIDELDKSANSFKLMKIRDKEFQFQSETNIFFYDDMSEDVFKTIEDIEDKFFNEIIKLSQLKYDYTIKLINALKDVLKIEVQVQSEKTELNIDEFFELLLDHAPCYNYEDGEDDDSFGNTRLVFYYVYQGFKNPNVYYLNNQNKARKILMHFRKEHALQNINDELVKGYLDELKFERNNFIMRTMNDKEYLCHCNAHCTSVFDVEEKMTPLEQLKKDWSIEIIAGYNQNRYEIILYLINGFENILEIEGQKEEKNPSNEISKLEMNLPVASIALLYRLLDEGKLLKYKNKTEIYRYISSTIKSANRENISEASVKNKFLSPDNSSIKSIEAILVNLKQILKKSNYFSLCKYLKYSEI